MKQPCSVAVAAALLLALAPTVAYPSASAAPRMPVRIRATVERLDKDILTVKTDHGDTLRLEMSAKTRVASLDARQLSDLEPNAFLGVTAVMGTDRKLHATRVYIFPESMRGSGEGRYPGRQGPNSTIINAAVTSIAPSPDGETVTLHHKNGARGNEGWTEVEVTNTVPIVAFTPGDKTLLTPGTDTVTVVLKDGDGDLDVLEVLTGKDHLKPPM